MNAGKTSCLWEKAEGTEFSKEWQGKQILSAPASVSDVPPLPQQKGTRFDSLPSFVTSQQVPWVGGMTLWKQRVLLLLVLYTSALHSADSYTFCRIRATKSVTCINGGIAPSREIDGSIASAGGKHERWAIIETRQEFGMVLFLNVSERPVLYIYADVFLL